MYVYMCVCLMANLPTNNSCYLLQSRAKTAGMKLIARASKLSGVSALEKRFTALAIAYIIVVFYDIARASYFLWGREALAHYATKFLSCKQVQTDCPPDYLHYSSPAMTIAAAVVIGLFCIASLLFLVGTPAQLKLWKYWVGRLLIFCRCPYASDQYSSWAVMPECHRSFRAQQTQHCGNGQLASRSGLSPAVDGVVEEHVPRDNIEVKDRSDIVQIRIIKETTC